MIKLMKRGYAQPLNYDIIKFSDGAMNVKVPSDCDYIVADITNVVEDLHILELVVDAYKNMFKKINVLHLSYVPNARADRVFEVGNAFPLKIVANHINAMEFGEVIVCDPHSDMSVELLNNVVVVHQEQCFCNATPFSRFTTNYAVCAPDKGAVEKCRVIAEEMMMPMICASKERDLKTGRILNTTLEETDFDISGFDIIIVDDICDGGGTFIPLAKLLKERGARSVSLYVSHGIFAKGLDIFKEDFHRIYVYNIVGEYVTAADINAFNLRPQLK